MGMEARRKMRFAMVCSSNMNRSMEAHSLLGRAGLDVASYGTGTHVKLPGPSLHEPNVYDFGTPYNVIYDDLRRKDPDLYKRNGLLPMLKRNTSVKLAPQRWQDNAGDGLFDVIFSFEERVFDLIVDGNQLITINNRDMHNREQRMLKNALIINMDVKDNHEEAGVGAKLALDLCQKLEGADEDWEEIIDDLIITFEKQHKRKLTYNMAFY
nr:RNA polymerase II subunit A C-terminal domain phosphatase SSU72 isoform X1 [Oryza sativa Japonica Group]